MVEELIELFLGPGGGAVSSQIVQHQQRGGAQLCKALIIGDSAGGAISGPQVVQQIGYGDEQGRIALTISIFILDNIVHL